MKLSFAAFALLFFVVAVFAGSFDSAAPERDGAGLILTLSDGSRFDAPLLPEQSTFEQARVSPDRHYAGWLANFPNCCTSYPVPLTLVVIDASKQLHKFDGANLAISSWCFLPDSSSVAFAQSVLHGSDFRHFELRTISDGRLVDQYEYPHDESQNRRARDLAPTWVRCVSQ